jgi:hypothetical protein
LIRNWISRICRSIIDVYERSTGMTVPARQPYAGELVFTAFSGSHQDAIKKGLAEARRKKGEHWDVPYLTIDPADIGREYREVIRVNSQSGKGGVAYLLESEFGIELPKDMQREFGPIANDAVDKLGREVSGAELKAMFWKEYVERMTSRFESKTLRTNSKMERLIAREVLYYKGVQTSINGNGNGPLAALVNGICQIGTKAIPRFEISNYSEHALSSGETAAAIAYIQIKTADGKTRAGARAWTRTSSWPRSRRVERAEPAVIFERRKIPLVKTGELLVSKLVMKLSQSSFCRRRCRRFFAAGIFPAAAQTNAVPRAPVYVPDLSHANEPLPDGVLAWDALLARQRTPTNGQDFARFTFIFTNVSPATSSRFWTSIRPAAAPPRNCRRCRGQFRPAPTARSA